MCAAGGGGVCLLLFQDSRMIPCVFARCSAALWQFLPCNTALRGGWWHSWQGGERGVGVGINKRSITEEGKHGILLLFPVWFRYFPSISCSVFSTPTPQKHPHTHTLFIVMPTIAVFSRLTAPPHISHLRYLWMHTGPYTLSLRSIQLFNCVKSLSGKRSSSSPRPCS